MDLLSLFYFLLPSSTMKKPFSFLPSPAGKSEIIHCRHFHTITQRFILLWTQEHPHLSGTQKHPCRWVFNGLSILSRPREIHTWAHFFILHSSLLHVFSQFFPFLVLFLMQFSRATSHLWEPPILKSTFYFSFPRYRTTNLKVHPGKVFWGYKTSYKITGRILTQAFFFPTIVFHCFITSFPSPSPEGI